MIIIEGPHSSRALHTLIDFKISVCFPFHVALATCNSSCFAPIIVILAVDAPSSPARVVIAIVMETAMVTLISLG